MPKVIEGNFLGAGKQFVIVASRFNEFICDEIVGGAIDTLTRHGVGEEDIKVIKVPGAFELPLAAQKVISSSMSVDAIICLGVLIRGATPHFDFIAAEATKGIATVAMDSGKPVTYGVITTDSIEQAIERAGTKAGNKGSDAAMAALELVNLYAAIEKL